MADKKEVSILLLGIVAILAIVGLVLLFTSPAATGRAWYPPPLPPTMETPAPVGVEAVPVGGYYGIPKRGLAAVMIPSLEGANLPRCPNGRLRTREQGNINYEAIPGYMCNWFFCPTASNPSDPVAGPILGCTKL